MTIFKIFILVSLKVLFPISKNERKQEIDVRNFTMSEKFNAIAKYICIFKARKYDNQVLNGSNGVNAMRNINLYIGNCYKSAIVLNS